MLDKQPGIREGRPQLVHSINGQASPNVPPIDVQQGQIVQLHIVNNTAEFHPMHLHGHVLSVLAKNGAALQGSPVHIDSILVGPGETWDVAFACRQPWYLDVPLPRPAPRRHGHGYHDQLRRSLDSV